MTELERQLATLLTDAPGEPPITLDPAALRSTPFARRRYLAPLLAAATVVVTVAAYVLIGHIRSHNRSNAVAEDGVAPQTIGRLWNLANQMATANGTTIKHAEAVLTTAAGASRVLFDSSGSHETTQPTWAVQAETTTSFACLRCLPPGSPPGTTPPAHCDP